MAGRAYSIRCKMVYRDACRLPPGPLARNILIVGGGPAGTTTALALAHAAPELARRVVLLEKARYPRDKPCAGALGARGDALLRGVGVEVDVPGVQIDGISFRGADGEAAAAPGLIGRVVRRVELDHALARAVALRGVEVRDGVRVEDVLDDGVNPVTVRTTAGDLAASVVVGCDGVGSVIRRTMGLGAGLLRAQVVEVDTEPVPGDRRRALLHFDASDRRYDGYAWDFPTIVNGRELMCRGVYRLATGRRGSGDPPELGSLLDERLRAMGIDPGRCENKRYAERGFEPATRLAQGARMLVGEAAGIDPVTGEGIAQAIEYGILAGRFLARVLGRSSGRARHSGQVRVDEWHDEVRASRLALDLRIRLRFANLFYGPARSALERVFTESPDALFVGCQHFAAQPYDWLRLGEVVGRGAAGLLAMRISTTLAS